MDKTIFPLFFFFFVLTSTIQEACSQPSRALFAPISPFTILPLFTLTLNSDEKYFVDINAPLLVRRCEGESTARATVPCASSACLLSRTFRPAPCSIPNNTFTGRQCACMASSFDPFSATCGTNQLTRENIAVSSTNPRKPTFLVPRVIALCVPTVFLGGLPPGIFGVAGLSRSPLSAAYQLASSNLGLSKKFALCLPSSDNADNRGVVFFGNGPYMLKSGKNLDSTRILSETPLIRNNKIPNGNYISLRGICVNGQDGGFGPSAFAFDSTGGGGTLLSTTTQYTTMRTDLYSFLLNEFSNATSQIPRADPVSPFGLCLRLSSNSPVQNGFNAPRIDLKLNNGRIWSVYGANSMKKVSDDVSCLAFVDGGASPRQTVVIGSYQMENNLMVFDLARSVLGFSSSLSLVSASCSDFQTGS
ncbi:PREDICTED: basic 7S globulin 2-like [Tarenaya hassleriana]|uniref:basic 7S globulin 2-like n=1 Tax=Tarenaya hassleriana TaxID=28532 RepID=UPI00053C23AB|nr:PREDICTED: basic 7S globulin 2-like [Tarenaya hassleriana]